MLIYVGRMSGPCTDVEASTEVTEAELAIIKDALCLVNAATGNKEGWYVRKENGPYINCVARHVLPSKAKS